MCFLNVIGLRPLSRDCTPSMLHYLVGAASITFKFIIRAQGLSGGEVSETVCHTRVLRNKGMIEELSDTFCYLININTKITELLILACHGLTVQASGLARQYSLCNGQCSGTRVTKNSAHLKYFIDPCYRVLRFCFRWLGFRYADPRSSALFTHNNFVDVVDKKD